MVDRFKWALVGPPKTHVTLNCPSSDANVKSEVDVQALVSLPFCCNKLSRMVVSVTVVLWISEGASSRGLPSREMDAMFSGPFACRLLGDLGKDRQAG